MVNEEKVILMTKLAIYEQSAGKEQIPLSSYYKSDYIKYNGLKTILMMTFGYGLLVAGIILINLEYILDNINKLNYKNILITLVLTYIIFVLIYSIASRVVSGRKFERTRSQILEYSKNLKKLNSMYQEELKETTKILRKKEVNETHDEFIDY